MHISTQNFGSGSYAKCFSAEGIYEYSDRIHQFPEIQYIIDGSLEIEVDGKKEVLHAGDIAVIAPFRVHTIRSTDGVHAWLMIFSNDLASDFIYRNTNHIHRSGCVFTPSAALCAYVRENMIDMGEQVVNLEGDPRLLFKVKALAYSVLEEYVRAVPRLADEAKPNALAKILIYISNHFKENITRETVSEALGYSGSYISHVISDLPEMNFRKLLNSVRIEHAKQLLLTSDFSVIDVAYECGFGGERSFYRAFMEIAHTTPNKFRQNKSRE